MSQSSWRRNVKSLLQAASLVEARVREVWNHNLEWVRASEAAARNHSYTTLKAMPTEIFGVHFMLVAFAVENMLKAGLVRAEQWDVREEFEKDGRLPRLLQSHDVFLLCSRLGIQLSVEEEDIARRLTRASIWAGRYPIPVQFRDSSEVETFSDGEEWSVGHFFENDPERLSQFVEKIRSETRM
jgi:hypothetical protein